MKTQTAEKEGRATPAEKRMIKGEAMKELDSIIGTPAPINEAIQLRAVIALHGADDETELPPELEFAVQDVIDRTKDSAKKNK